MEGISDDDVELIKHPSFQNLSKLAIQMSDAVIEGSEVINNDLVQFIETTKKPFLKYHAEHVYMDAYSQFYDTILNEFVHDPK